MSLLVVGSIAFDTIETEKELKKDLLGGSATYFSFAAGLYTKVNLVGVVGKDFPKECLDSYQAQSIDTQGLQVEEGETLRWWGKYSKDMNHRETVEIHLNVFGDFNPVIPKNYQNIPYLFLGNGSPVLQSKVLEQMSCPTKFIALDTMDLWINTQREELLKVIQNIHCLFLNDAEARLLTEKTNLIQAGRQILEMGPKVVIIKKGEHGALMISPDGIFTTPAFPLDHFNDPTGAGDSFAGGFMGYLAREDDISFDTLKKAILHGTVVASYTVEDFGVHRLEGISEDDIEKRMAEFMNLAYV